MANKQFEKFLVQYQAKDYKWLSEEWTKRHPEDPKSYDAVRKAYRSLDLPQKKINVQNKELPVEAQVEKDITVTRLRENKATSDKKYSAALDQVRTLSNALEAAIGLKAVTKTHKIAKSKSTGGEATAFMVASDWHVEEVVKPGQVNGVNEYNVDIARQRADNFFANGVRLVKLFQQGTRIDNIVVPLLGDFISGNLHEDSMEKNGLGVMEAIEFAKELIASGIKHILENTDCKITLVCHSGNHGRITKRVHWGTENQNSLEWLMYRSLAYMFKDESRVLFIIPESDVSYLDVYDMKIRFIHGHQVKYGGGVGGITIPMVKAVSKWDRVQPADLTVFGHFHQRIDGGNFIGNGSLIGYNAYAQSMKCDYEDPAQQFFLISSRKGGEKSVVTPIWLD